MGTLAKPRRSRRSTQFRTVFYFKPVFKSEYEWFVKAEKLLMFDDPENPSRIFLFSKDYSDKRLKTHFVESSTYNAANIRGIVYGDYDTYIPSEVPDILSTEYAHLQDLADYCSLVDNVIYSVPEFHREKDFVLNHKRKIIAHYWKENDMYYTLNALNFLRNHFEKDSRQEMRRIDFNRINPFPNREGTKLLAVNGDVLTMYLLEKRTP
ncbi:hypothetical protein Rm378p131 [Rhodothermus phage RM378]|uniref:hypothetical protein n=1 Tax=Rhodothermus phage RM378 TaxID=148943 RepID=UPI000018F683|nr:hypothetical protein Rm378p131 [Rhodothermus phage RM378]